MYAYFIPNSSNIFARYALSRVTRFKSSNRSSSNNRCANFLYTSISCLAAFAVVLLCMYASRSCSAFVPPFWPPVYRKSFLVQMDHRAVSRCSFQQMYLFDIVGYYIKQPNPYCHGSSVDFIAIIMIARRPDWA